MIAFRWRVIKYRDSVTVCKNKEIVVPEYEIRWKGYEEIFDQWVSKIDISSDFIKESNSVPIDAASKILATVPVGLHPSSPRCAITQAMSTMVQ